MTRNPHIVAAIETAGADPVVVSQEQYTRIEAAWDVINKQYPDVREPITGDLTDDREEERNAARVAAVQIVMQPEQLKNRAAEKIRAAHAYRISLAALAGAIVAAGGTDQEIAKRTGVHLSRVTTTRAGQPLTGYEVPGH